MTRFERSCSLLAILASLWLGAPPRASAEPIVVVVGKDSPVSALKLGDLQRIFLSLPMQDARGVPFVPFNYPAKTAVRERFDDIVLGMSPEEVGQHWIDQKIRGHQAPPRTMHSPSLLCRVVARLPGAIAYIPASLLGPQCKVVAIDGRRPKDLGYVLASDAPPRSVASALVPPLTAWGSWPSRAPGPTGLARGRAWCPPPRSRSTSSRGCSRRRRRCSRAPGTA